MYLRHKGQYLAEWVSEDLVKAIDMDLNLEDII